MGNFAVINNNEVVNIITADTKEIAETVTNLTCIEFEYGTDHPHIGYGWDGSSFISNQTIPEPSPQPEN